MGLNATNEDRDSGSLKTEKLLMSRKELAEWAGISEDTLDRDRKDGVLKATKIRGRVMFTKQQIDRWLKNRSRNVS